jgi:hypothetical protein
MPYISPQRRAALEPDSRYLDPYPQNAGELNYAITMLLIQYWEEHGPKYQAISDISGACNEALAEFRRRVVGKYEDQKIKENGDVYGP